MAGVGTTLNYNFSKYSALFTSNSTCIPHLFILHSFYVMFQFTIDYYPEQVTVNNQIGCFIIILKIKYKLHHILSVLCAM